MLKEAKCFGCLRSFVRNFAKKSLQASTNQEKMKYLNVAEKHDAAKTIAGLLSNGTASRREGYSVYNKVFDFEANVRGTKSKMIMTSVSGHLLTHEFLSSYRNWRNVDPSSLFDAPVRKACPEDYQPIKRTLEREIRSCGGLIIWTDCDREGENIGFEIIDVCRAVKPNITVYRAIFSEITGTAVRRALQQLKQPDKRQSDAVDIRSELDLRTGAAITRFQTLRLQRLFPQKIADKLISYGSCQIPTLGFVVERYKEIEAFISEPFWKIEVTHTIDDLTVEFNWDRNRLFDKQTCEDYYVLCLADPHAKVENVSVKPKSKWRPTPLDTVELEKLGSRKLKISAKEVMTIAEKLYTKGIISYPRTETNQFSKEIDLGSLVEQQTGHNVWGAFAERVISWGPNPRNGNKSDQAHPPIHPTKLVTNLDGNEARVYELICRHFLACVSKDATGSETIVKIDIAGEKFTATGLCIYERNYLDVYIYDKWNAKQIHNYTEGQVFDPTEISMPEGATTPPALLTEADLIALMEKHGIGTDATHAEHINTIKERGYIGVVDRGFLVPGVIGMGLYEGYDAMQLALAKPVLRAEFEADLKRICLGEKDPKIVLREQIIKYKEAYKQIMEKVTAMDEKMGIRINETPTANSTGDGGNVNFENNPNLLQEIFKCPKCNVAPMAVKPKKNQSGFFIGCLNFPDCKNVVWLPDECLEPMVLDEMCPNCGDGYKMLKFKFSTAYYKALFNTPGGRYKTCLGCDTKFRENFNINLENVKRVGSIVAAGGPSTNASSAIGNVANVNINTNRIGSGVNVDNNANGNSGSSNTSNATGRGSRSKPGGTENKTTQSKRSKKTTTTTTTTNSKNIRSFFTSTANTTTATSTHQSSSSTATSAQTAELADLNNIESFFNSNDSFDALISTFEGTNNENQTTRNEISENLRNDIVAAFEDDDDDDWAINIVNTTSAVSNQAANARGSSQNTSTLYSNSNNNRAASNNDLDDSFSDIYRTEIDYNSIAWGSAGRNQRVPQGPETKRPRLETPDTAFASTSSGSWGTGGRDSSINNNLTPKYTWGSAERAATTQVSSHNVKCTGCHQDAKEFAVKKDGPNKGRIFYVCPKDRRCKFFQWADELSTTSPAARDDSSSNLNDGNDARTATASFNNNVENTRDSYSWGTGTQSVSAGSGRLAAALDANAQRPRDAYSWGTNSRMANASSSTAANAYSRRDSSSWGTGSQTGNESSDTATASASTSNAQRPRDSYSWGTGSQTSNAGSSTAAARFNANAHTRRDSYSWGTGSQTVNANTGTATAAPSSSNAQSPRDSYSWGTGSQTANAGSSTANRNQIKNNITTTTDSNEVKCNCGNPAISLKVRKDGPNKGRSFFNCAQRSCNFFQWGDENDNQTSNSSKTGEAKKRKCGLCRQEGHTKQKCPRKAEFDFFT